jgi:putative transposase
MGEGEGTPLCTEDGVSWRSDPWHGPLRRKNSKPGFDPERKCKATMRKAGKRRGKKSARRAELRFAVIGGLLASPPGPGDLGKELDRLAERRWRDPATGQDVLFGKSTIERWFYKARPSENPVDVLKTKPRVDLGRTDIAPELVEKWRALYEKYPHWSIQLLYVNFAAWARHERKPPLGKIPSYSTLRRIYVVRGWIRLRAPRLREDGTPLPASVRAEVRRVGKEIRSFEAQYVGALWHLDYHKGTRAVLLEDGSWAIPVLLAIMDDCSRLVCHAQWYLEETTESLVHGFTQAIQKRGLPRAQMSDNGKPMTSEEFTEGLGRLSIQHELTLEYSPYQNGKQEKFWALIEGRFLPMLVDVRPLTLNLLNDMLQVWVEGEYHRTIHSEIGTTPIERFSAGKRVLRDSPGSDQLRQTFLRELVRRQRKTDGTFSLDGVRFEVPSAYRHHSELLIHYAKWDLSRVFLVDPSTGKGVTRLLPLDKAKNNHGKRAIHAPPARLTPNPNILMDQLPPQMRHLLRESQRTHLPPAYVPQTEPSRSHENNPSIDMEN